MNLPAIQFHDQDPGQSSFMDEVIAGLSKPQKQIPPKFFYDERGSELFDQICDLPEYYPTRTEIGILEQNADDIADVIGSECLLIELGSGASKKIRLLLNSLQPDQYMGVDISRDFLLDSTRLLARDYPWLEVHAVCADFSRRLELPTACHANSNRVAFFPGSSIGNFEPVDARHFLTDVAAMLGQEGLLLIGVDLKKDSPILNQAYNDQAGVTAAFNLNLLTRMAHDLGAKLDINHFSHHAFYNELLGRVEMHLVSTEKQAIEIAGQQFELDKNETIHTENSYKYSLDEFRDLTADAGFRREHVWTDADKLFSVQLYRVV